MVIWLAMLWIACAIAAADGMPRMWRSFWSISITAGVLLAAASWGLLSSDTLSLDAVSSAALSPETSGANAFIGPAAMILLVATGTGATLLAALGPANLSTSLGTLLLAASTLGCVQQTAFSLPQLLQTIAAADLGGIACAACWAGVANAAKSTDQQVWRRLKNRAGCQVLLLSLTSAALLWRNELSTPMPQGFQVWLLTSEVIAGTVIWRVAHRLAEAETSWKERAGLLIASVGAMLSLAVAPLANLAPLINFAPALSN